MERCVRFLRIADFYKDTLNIQNEQMAEHLAEISRLETLEKGHRVISMGEKMEMLPILVTISFPATLSRLLRQTLMFGLLSQ